MRKSPERNLTNMVAEYLQRRYPSVIYRFDLASDQRLSIQQAKRNSKIHGKLSRGYPDLLILEPRNIWHGLFLELKTTTPFKKDGGLKKDQHLERQNSFHLKLINKGYKAGFSTGFEETKKRIDEYLAL